MSFRSIGTGGRQNHVAVSVDDSQLRFLTLRSAFVRLRFLLNSLTNTEQILNTNSESISYEIILYPLQGKWRASHSPRIVGVLDGLAI